MLREDACRLCLSQADHMRSLQALVPYTVSCRLMDVINKLTSVNATLGDGLPQNVCGTCERDLLFCHEFALKIERMDLAMRQINFQAPTDPQSVVIKSEIVGEDEENVEFEGSEYSLPCTMPLEITLTTGPGSLSPTQLAPPDDRPLEATHLPLAELNGEQHALPLPSMAALLPKDFNSTTGLRTESCKGKLACRYCFKEFPNQWDLKSHLTSHSEERPYKCLVCNFLFKRRHHLTRHAKLHSSEEIACALTSAKRAPRPVKTETHQCELCGKDFATIKKLREHLRWVHTNARPYACNLCDKCFKRQSDLNAHMKRHSNKNKQSWMCEFCDKVFLNLHALTTHKIKACKSIKEEQRIEPKVERNDNITTAILSVPVKPEPAILTNLWPTSKNTILNSCEFCDQTFNTCDKLREHCTREHREDMPYKCNACDKRFKYPSNLKSHVSRHTVGSNRSCPVCYKEFLNSCAWVMHRTIDCRPNIKLEPNKLPNGLTKQQKSVVQVKTEIDELDFNEPCNSQRKRHYCDHCDKSYARKQRLSLHMRTHLPNTERKITECPLCGKRLSRDDALQRHLKLHSTKAALLCTHCDRSYFSEREYSTHIKKHCAVKFAEKLNNVVKMELPMRKTRSGK